MGLFKSQSSLHGKLYFSVGLLKSNALCSLALKTFISLELEENITTRIFANPE